ncbi:tyrosine-type recombinase/integrase [Paenibacillus bouchesdurhonensis]|uniref:tyrosine-type recombinase/integrase n=1 Tax=Paenibacillus bouchesdurhonensis TaxID=1870990 RepID=UPI000DA63D4C|nr:site-specific integrase [Paenibacillus bouchesdurhonensis]
MARRKKDALPPNVRRRGKGYTYRYSIPIITEDGKKDRKQTDTPSYPTPEEAYKAGILIEAQLVQGNFIDEDKTVFNLWAPQMLVYHSRIKKLHLNTIHTYKYSLVHPCTFFNGVKVKDITPNQYQDFLLWLQDERKLATKSIESLHGLLNALFRHAVQRGQIATSPSIGATIPREEDQEDFDMDFDEEADVPNFLEKEQLAKVISAAKQKAEQAATSLESFDWRQFVRAIYIMAHTGIRIGELCVLEPKKINFKKLKIRISATLYDKEGLSNYQIGPPKTKSSRRLVDISDRVAAVIEAQIRDVKAFRLMVGPKYHKNKEGREFIFVNPTEQLPGYPMRPTRLNEMLDKALVAAEFPSKFITAHGLRHTYTSLSAEVGVPLDDIRKQLGHTKDDLTTRVYLHVTEARRRANVDKLDSYIGDLL